MVSRVGSRLSLNKKLIMFYKIKMAFSLQKKKKKTPQIWNENCTKPHLLNTYKK